MQPTIEQPADPAAAACPQCGGRGWKVVADGGAGAAVRCDCQKRARGEQLLAAAGIPPRYRRCRLDGFSIEHSDPRVKARLFEARRKSQLYIDGFYDAAEKGFTGGGLIYVGPPGVGKTHLATAVLRELIGRFQVRGRFVNSVDFLRELRATFDPDSGASQGRIWERVATAELLVLDELGAEKPTGWAMETLYTVINERYTQRLPTLFTTNFPLAGSGRRHRPSDGEAASDAAISDDRLRRHEVLGDRIPAPLVSRLFEMAQVVELAKFDYRREVKRHQHRLG